MVSLDEMFPLTLGANIGTTITGILAAVVSDTTTSMQVALSHFFFNIFGICIWYPVPFMRRVPIAGAKALGRYTRWWRGFPFLYIAVAFFGIPLLLLGLSDLLISDSAALVCLGVILVIVLILGLAKTLWWWFRKDGASKTEMCFKRRQLKRDVHDRLVDEWDPLVRSVKALRDHVGFEEEEEVIEVTREDHFEKEISDGTDDQLGDVMKEDSEKERDPAVSLLSA
jgi:sodium-dependent phosphate cotransporter